MAQGQPTHHLIISDSTSTFSVLLLQALYHRHALCLPIAVSFFLLLYLVLLSYIFSAHISKVIEYIKECPVFFHLLIISETQWGVHVFESTNQCVSLCWCKND